MLSRVVFKTVKKRFRVDKLKKKKYMAFSSSITHQTSGVEGREGSKYVLRKQILGKNKNTDVFKKHAKNTCYKLFTNCLNRFSSKYCVTYHRPNGVSKTQFIQNDFLFLPKSYFFLG